MKPILLCLLAISTAALTACGSDYPTETDIASAWKTYQPDTADLYSSESMKNLKCTKAGNQAVYCDYLMGEVQHSDALKKNSAGQWEVLMLNKKDESDD